MCSPRRRLLPLGLAALLALMTTASLPGQQAGSLDSSFDPGFGIDGKVNALAIQRDGRIVVSGSFSHVDGQEHVDLARLNTDGSVDATFHPPLLAGTYSFSAAQVNAIVPQPDGHLLVGGIFTQADGSPHAGLVRLRSDGSLDNDFAPAFDRISGVVHFAPVGIYALAIQSDGRIVAAGVFSSVNGQARRGVARLMADGTLDAAFDPATPAKVFPAQGIDGDVRHLSLGPKGEVYVAGSFTTVNGVARPALARLRAADGNLDTTFAPTPIDRSSSVSALACQPNGDVLVAGSFVQPDGASGGNYRADLARFHRDGNADESFSHAHRNSLYSFSTISTILVQPEDGSVVIAGDHLYLDGLLCGAAGRYLASGKVDKTFYSGLDPLASTGAPPSVTALALRRDGGLVAGGTFDSVDGTLRGHLTGLRGHPSTDCPVISVKVTVPVIIAPGFFGDQDATRPGVFQLRGKPAASSALAIRYRLSGKGTRLIDSPAFDEDTLPIQAGKAKARVKVAATPGAVYSAGSGQTFNLDLEPGRGYAVGTQDSARMRVVPPANSDNP